MQRIPFFDHAEGPRRILALGAHADDIEIGCGGTLLRLLAERTELEVTWVVFCAPGSRNSEARGSASAFLTGARESRVIVRDYRDGYLPYAGSAVKEAFEELKQAHSPDLIFTHFREDRHQDHRLVSELTWNTWRNHMILEYEIPKYDGDFGSPNWFAPISAEALERKAALVLKHFPSQASKHWFDGELLRAVARIRGMECVAPEGFAEAFYCRKAVV
jgi:LmbE family N-acetylglucosaminyl deacetylase